MAAVDPRTIQANERTLLAWIRTGLALITFGFAMARLDQWLAAQGFSSRADPSHLVGAFFVLLGALAEVVGLVRYRAVRRALLAGDPIPTAGGPAVVLAAATTAVGLGLGAYVFLFI